MEDQSGNPTASMLRDIVYYCSNGPPKGREWFWGVVLTSLLMIGCVECNPGPRPNEAPGTERPRANYGSTESRLGRQWLAEETPTVSGCWPFMWWCKSETLSDEENLLGRSARRGPGRVQSSKAHLIDQQNEIDVLKETVKILNSNLEQEIKQRKEERKDHEAKIVSYEKTQEESVRIHNDLQAKLEEANQQKAVAEKQLLEFAHKNEQLQTEGNADRFNKEFQRRKQLEEDLESERQEQKKVTATLEQEILTRQQLEQEMRVLQLDREAELREQNQQHEIQRGQLQQAVETEVQKREDLTQQLEEVNATLEEEMLKRQELEQEMRVWQLNRETEITEQNQEHEIQRRQMQQTVEIEVQRRQELAQQLDQEMKHRQEETQRRLRLEVELQEEIQAREELELEFKQADLESQILEEELREQLRQLQRVLKSGENTDVEVDSLIDNEEERSRRESESNTTVSEEATDKTEEREAAGDNENEEDEEERREIRQLLLEEFQRLEQQQAQGKPPTDVTADDSKSQNSEEISIDSVQEQGHLDRVMETDLNTDIEAIITRDLVQDDQQGADFEETNVNWDTLMTDDSGDDERPHNDERAATEVEDLGSNIIFRSSTDSSLSEDRHSSEEYGERRKGILLKPGLTLDLENIVKEHKINDVEAYTKTDSSSAQNHNLDILTKVISFQGKDITIASIIGEPITPQTQDLLDELKSSLNSEEKPIIGYAFTHSEGPYIPRTLQRNTFLRSEVLKKRTSKLPPVFAISGTTQQELKETALPDEKISRFDGDSGIETSGSRIVLLNDVTAAHDFKELCNRARKFKTIHWLAKLPEGFEWRRSKGNMDDVQQHIDFSKSKRIPSIKNLKGETVIISGKRGEGKSTYLTHLQTEVKETSPDIWVIRLNLNEHPSLKENCEITESHVIELLSRAAGLETSPNDSTGKALLKYSLQITGKITVLIDEVDNRHRDKVSDLLRILNNMKTINIVIATDACLSTAIENSASTLACTLKPLTKKELQLLMTKLWTTDLPHDDDDNNDDDDDDDGDDNMRDKFSAELLHVIGKYSISGDSPTPLDIKMASHIFQKEYKAFLSTKVVNLPDSLDNTELHERYIAWGFETCKDNTLGSANVWDSYLAHVTHCSMSSLFPEDNIEEIFPLEESTTEITDNIPPLCPTLQEYVTAKWFAENYQNHRPFIEGKYFEAELQALWAIFERILVKQSELHMAVLDGDIQRVGDLLAGGHDVNCLDKGGRTALHVAAVKGKYLDRQNANNFVQIASLLIDYGADISIVDGILKWTALRYADRTASWTIVDRLLPDVADDTSDMSYTKDKLKEQNFLQEILTEAGVKGLKYVTAFVLDNKFHINTPLNSTRYSNQQYALVHIASENGHNSLLEFLLSKGADANARIWDNSTALHLACRQGNKECVVTLLETSACTSQSNKNGDLPLHEAVRSMNSDIVQILLSENAEDAEICNNDGDTPLHVACQVNNLTAVSHFVDRKLYRNIRNKNGDSPLDCAIKGGHTTLVKYILKAAKESVLDHNTDGHKPVHIAAEIGDVLMLEYILKVMPEVNVSTNGGDTPLHIASLHGHKDVADFLLKMGADSNTGNRHGNTALHLASVRGHTNTMKKLMESNPQVNATNEQGNTPLHLACLQGQTKAVRCLLQHKANTDMKNREKNTPMHLAAIKGYTEIVNSLIEANCDVNIPDKYGDTILHHCARNGKLESVEKLLVTGRCQQDVMNCKGDTPLVGATRSGYGDIVECLVGAGADVNYPTENGDVSLHLAARQGDLEMVTLLCRLGADVNISNSGGSTALHAAVCGDSERIVRVLVQNGADRSIRNSSGETPLELAVRMECNDAIRRAL